MADVQKTVSRSGLPCAGPFSSLRSDRSVRRSIGGWQSLCEPVTLPSLLPCTHRPVSLRPRPDPPLSLSADGRLGAVSEAEQCASGLHLVGMFSCPFQPCHHVQVWELFVLLLSFVFVYVCVPNEVRKWNQIL